VAIDLRGSCPADVEGPTRLSRDSPIEIAIPVALEKPTDPGLISVASQPREGLHLRRAAEPRTQTAAGQIGDIPKESVCQKLQPVNLTR
jgi:hypothetical protein